MSMVGEIDTNFIDGALADVDLKYLLKGGFKAGGCISENRKLR